MAAAATQSSSYPHSETLLLLKYCKDLHVLAISKLLFASLSERVPMQHLEFCLHKNQVADETCFHILMFLYEHSF